MAWRKINDTKLTAIADAIRGKTGKSDALTLDAMPTEIAGIETGGGEGIKISNKVCGITVINNTSDRVYFYLSRVYLELDDSGYIFSERKVVWPENEIYVSNAIKGGLVAFTLEGSGEFSVDESPAGSISFIGGNQCFVCIEENAADKITITIN